MGKFSIKFDRSTNIVGRDPWYSGYKRRLVFKSLWVQIPESDTRWTFFHIDLLQKLICLFEKT